MRLLPLILIPLAMLTTSGMAQTDPKATEVWDPIPPVVAVGVNGIPSDATVLFDGSNFDHWRQAKNPDGPVAWDLAEGHMTVKPGTGFIATKADFGDVQLHIEWRTPEKIEGKKGQQVGNSGVFFCGGKYEVQVLDSHENRTYSNGQAGAIYKQHMPLANATRPPMAWQAYDIVFRMPRFDAQGEKTKPGTLTVFHNGVLIQDHSVILGTTEYIGPPKNNAHGEGPISLQDHGNRVSYRNIWVRRLK